jgi:type I restriction enzyme, R subunit
MTRITENTIEKFTIKLLEHNGYEYIYAPNIAYEMQPKLMNSEIKICD